MSDLDTLIHDARVAANSHEDGHPTHDAEAMAGLALRLSVLHDQILDVLEPLKEALRDEARDRSDSPHPRGGEVVRINGHDPRTSRPLGYVTVTFPDDSVRLAGNANVARLQRTLGPRFSDYFETKTSYRPVKDFENRVEAILANPASPPATQAEARTALAGIEVKEATPRVGFKPRPA